MARYQVILAYDGTQFMGYQRQHASAGRTVQGEIEAALRRLGWTERTIYSAGRTDTGVHASGQVIAFDLDWSHSGDALQRAMNAELPGDIAAQSVVTAPPDFHPRYAAAARCYHYHLFCQENRNPLRERYAWRVWPSVELQLLQAAARSLVGEHDFSAFGAPTRPGGATIRSVLQADWHAEENGLTFVVVANAFLYHMVRRLVYLQVQIGQGRLDLSEFQQGVNIARAQTSGLALANGLVLYQVIYPSSGCAAGINE